MNLKRLVLPSCVVLLSAGCASVNVNENLLVLDQNYFPDKGRELSAVVEKADKSSPLAQAYRQVTKKPPALMPTKDAQLARAHVEAEPLPSYLVSEPLVQKMIIAAYEALEEPKGSVAEISKSDIQSMVGMLNRQFGADDAGLMAEMADSEKRINKIIQQYLSAYYSEKSGFVNREGVVFKRPEIKNSIGNDVVTAVVAISMEGLFDGLLSTPVYVDDARKYQTNEGREPSAHFYRLAASETVVARGQAGIDELELKAIRYLSGLAGDQSKTLSGAAYRAFGGLELSFVIGGKFSFGDNETLAKVLDTVFEVTSKRIVEERAYRGFKKLTVKYPVTPSAASSKAETLLMQIH